MVSKIKILKTKGFTLVELLVVIAIISILATIVIVSLASARAKARDARRKSDITEVRAALEMYKDMNGSYPEKTSTVNLSSLTDISQFLNPVPDDPIHTGSQNYKYKSTDNGTGYAIRIYWDGGTTADKCKVGVNDDTLFTKALDCDF